ncbi:MAG: hypothetical protein IT380_21845 [Myxococcales bacterium]|nr:hypothetical protein [Myxococcales bacterium]
MRGLVVGGFALLALGCGRLERTKGELAAAHLDEQRLAAQVESLERRTHALESSVDAERARASRANADLRAQQVTAVARWKGEPAKLDELKKQAPLPATLGAALDTAQAMAGSQTAEKRFVQSVARKDSAELERVLEYWEDGYLAAVLPPVEKEPAKVCPVTRSLACKRIDEDSLWCPDPSNHAAWALLLENGSLAVARLPGGDRHAVDSRLAPRVWLTKAGSGEDEVLMAHELRGTASLEFRTQWQSRVFLKEGRLENLRADLDDDAWTEALFWTTEELLLLDPTSASNLLVLRGLSVCDALTESTQPPPRPVTELCARWRNPPGDAGAP